MLLLLLDSIRSGSAISSRRSIYHLCSLPFLPYLICLALFHYLTGLDFNRIYLTILRPRIHLTYKTHHLFLKSLILLQLLLAFLHHRASDTLCSLLSLSISRWNNRASRDPSAVHRASHPTIQAKSSTARRLRLYTQIGVYDPFT